MSTVLNNTSLTKIRAHARFAELARCGEIIFHTKDLANLWQINNANTLHTTIKRYIKQGLLFRIYKGFYSIKPLSQLDGVTLGIKAMHDYAYISTETVLEREGIILQVIPYITLVSNKSKRFTVGNNEYYSRQLKPQYLYNPHGIVLSPYREATLSRAVADLLYFNPYASFDQEQRIDWKEVRKVQETVGFPLTPSRYK